MSRSATFPSVLNRRSVSTFFELVSLGLIQAGCLVGTAILIRQLFGGSVMLAEWSAWDLVLALGLLGAIAAVSRWRERICAESLAVNYVHEIRLKLFDAASINSLQPGVGVQIVRFSNDLTALRQWVSLGFARGISSTLLVLGLILAIALIDRVIAFAVGATLAMGVLLATEIGLHLERRVVRLRASRGGLANKVSEILQHLPTIVSSGRVGKERRRLERASDRLGQCQLKRAFWQGLLRAMVESINRICMLVVVVIGLLGTLAIGVLAAADLIAIFAVVSMLNLPVRDLGRVYEYWKNNKVARANLRPLLSELDRAEAPSVRLRTGSGSVCIRGGRVGPHLRLEDIEIEAGARIAVCGDNGAGKSTLLHTIAGSRFDDARSQAKIYLDGEMTRRLTDRDRRRAIGIAGGDTPLIAGSVSKNIRYRLPRAGETEMENAIQDTGLSQFIAEFPEGLMTRIGKGRYLPSQGQAARIKLARAVIGYPRLLLLDEIEQGMDSEGRRILARLIDAYSGTVIYATHDIELARLADRIWMLRDDAIDVLDPGRLARSKTDLKFIQKREVFA